MHGLSESLDGLRKELREFMRSCETLLSLGPAEALTDDEAEIVRCYIQWLNEKCCR